MKFAFLNPLDIKARLRRKPERIGLELEAGVVRIVKTERDENGDRKIVAFESLDINLWHASPLELQRFKAAIKRISEGNNKVAVNMEHSTLRVRRMNLAKMPDRDLLEAIKWNFREQIEVPIEKYVVGYTPLSIQTEGSKFAFMAYGVSQDAVIEHANLMRSLGLKLVSLEPSATALLASLYYNGLLSDGKYHVCISFGEATSHFLVMKGQMVLFSRPLANVSHVNLIKHIVRDVSLEPKEAENEIKKWIESGESYSMNLSDDGTEATDETTQKLETSIKIYFSRLVIEIQRSIDAFCIMYGAEGVQAVHICGGGAFYPGLVTHLNKTLGLTTDIFDPFANMLKDQPKEGVAAVSPYYAVAVGLSIP